VLILVASLVCRATTSNAATSTPAHCSTSSFAIREASQDGGAGSFFLGLGLRNTSSHSCLTGGYARITLLGAGGRPLGAGTRTGHKDPTLDVAPGSSVYEVIRYGETPESGRVCRTVEGVRISAPKSTQTRTARIPAGSQDCSRGFEVYPLAKTVAESQADGMT
jgi:hypothetical protein